MDQVQREPTFDESVKQVMQTLPPPIRNYLAQGKYSVVANNLMTKYALHIDQGGILEREIMLLLMGIENPDEFTKALVEEAKLDQQTINGIVQDINIQIFIPLQEEMRKGAKILGQQLAKPVMPPAAGLPKGSVQTYAPRPSVASQPAGAVGPPPQSPTYFHLENKIAPPFSPKASQGTARPINPALTAPGGRPALRDVLAAITKTPLPSPKATEGTAKPMESSKLLEDHEEPHIGFSKAPVQLVPSQTTTPPNLPGALPPRVVPEVRPSPELLKVESQAQPILPKVEPPDSKAVPIVPAKPYSGDPYREPIE